MSSQVSSPTLTSGSLEKPPSSQQPGDSPDKPSTSPGGFTKVASMLKISRRRSGGHPPPASLDPAAREAQMQKLRKKYGKAKPDIIRGLPLKTLMILPVEILNNLPPDRVVLLPDEVLPRLSPQVLMNLKPQDLHRLPVDVLDKLPSIVLVRLHPAILSELHSRTIANVLKQDPRIHQHLSQETLCRLRDLPRAEFLSLPPDVQVAVPRDDFDAPGNPRDPKPYATPPDPPPIEPQPFERINHLEPATPTSSSWDLPMAAGPSKPGAAIDLARTVQDARLDEVRGERDKLQAQVIQLKVESQRASEAVVRFLQDNQWKEECEPSDPLKPLFNFASYYLSAAGKNWSSSDYWTKAYKTEEARRIGLEATVQDLKTKLQHAETEYWKSAKRVEELQETFHATVTARTAELRAEAEKQKNKYGKTIHDQRVYYTKENQKLQQIIDSIDDTHQATLKSQEKKHSDAVSRLKDQHAKEMDKQHLDHEAQVQEMTKAHEKQLVQARLDREQALVQQKKSHQQDVLDMERRVVSLESSLVDNSDDFRPATDDSLKFKYQQLKLAVETITYNLGAVAIPPNSQLDPGRFLEKEGKTETRFLLQSILWEHIKDGFFSSPFGLGALGTGDGKKKLLDLYVAYRSLFDTDPSTGSSPTTEASSIALFRTSNEANRWRSATFQSILVAVLPKRGSGSNSAKSPPPPPPLGPLTENDLKSPYLSNRTLVHTTVLGLLTQVSTAAIPDSIAATVAHLVNTAGELALELGVQRAELGLEMLERGAQVQIGQSGFVDCYDGDADKGAVKEVVLAVSPRLYKRGDGRGDMKTGKIIFHGEVYVARG